jgi:hypothetical protein
MSAGVVAVDGNAPMRDRAVDVNSRISAYSDALITAPSFTAPA